MCDNKEEAKKERTKEIREEETRLLLTPPQRSKDSLVCLSGKPFKMQVVYEAAYNMGIDPIVANKWVDYMDQVGWIYRDCGEVTKENFRRSLRMFGVRQPEVDEWQAALSERKARRLARKRGKRRDGLPDYEAIDAKRRAIDAKRREEASKADGAWDLCAERCANCLGGKHCPYYATPPQLREWPLAPEQCSKFKPLEAKGASL